MDTAQTYGKNTIAMSDISSTPKILHNVLFKRSRAGLRYQIRPTSSPIAYQCNGTCVAVSKIAIKICMDVFERTVATKRKTGFVVPSHPFLSTDLTLEVTIRVKRSPQEGGCECETLAEI